MATAQALPEISSLWDFQDPAKSEASFRALLQNPEAQLQASYYWQVQTQVARSLGLQRKFEDAHGVLDGVEAALASFSDLQPIVFMRYSLERGRVYNSDGQSEKAKEQFLEAWQLGQNSKLDALTVDAAHMLGIVETREQALLWNERALELAESSEEPGAQKWKGALYNNIAWTYHDLGRFEDALTLFERALLWREAQGDILGTQIARWSVARAHRSLEHYEKALDIQRQLLAEHASLGTEDAYVYEELGECLAALKQEQEAQAYFAQAYVLLAKDTWFVANEAERLERLRVLGNVD